MRTTAKRRTSGLVFLDATFFLLTLWYETSPSIIPRTTPTTSASGVGATFAPLAMLRNCGEQLTVHPTPNTKVRGGAAKLSAKPGVYDM
eukprot:3299929-Pleurochrysis_carterae.AAC.1